MLTNETNHIDLFSGIGGFALAAKWTGFETVVFCEKDEYCQKVLKKHWPEVPIIPEIRDFDGTKWRGTTLLTGGFPCQPFSVAGKRRGKEDDRYLWPEMLRVIKEAKPRWILAENVAGIFKMALDTVLADLESEGYTTGTVIIPACATNAPHRRDRIWIIGHSTNNGCPRSRTLEQGRQNQGIKVGKNKTDQQEWKRRFSVHSTASNLASDWEIPWIEVATRFCRVDDGVPNRVDRLKSLGNAIVPQVAAEIMSHIKEFT